MADTVIDELLAEPGLFSVYQAARVLEDMYPNGAEIGSLCNPSDEVVRFRNVPSLLFQPSHLSSVTRDDDGGRSSYRMETSLLGLYGICSPLPMQYTAELTSSLPDDSEAIDRLRGFLDLFNHRLISLAYRVDSYRLYHRTVRKKSDSGDSAGPSSTASAGWIIGAVAALIGMDKASLEKNSQQIGSRLGDLACLISDYGSATAITRWLRGHFAGIQVEIKEHTPVRRTVPESERACLGKNACLQSANLGSDGEMNSVIGEQVIDDATKFTVQLGPLNWVHYLELLPNGTEFERLKRALAVVTPDWLEYDVDIVLAAESSVELKICLDGKSSWLGYTTGLIGANGATEEWRVTLH